MKNLAKTITFIFVGLAILIPLASTYPDGLERVSESLGIKEPEPIWTGIMPDYTLNLIENPYITTLVSGVIGILLVFSVSLIISTITTQKTRVS